MDDLIELGADNIHSIKWNDMIKGNLKVVGLGQATH